MENAKIKKMHFKYKNFERLEEKMREIHKIIKIEREKRKYKQTKGIIWSKFKSKTR